MATLKPYLVRADTIDLQDHRSPSAQDHSRQPTHPAPLGLGPAAPHHSQALRNASQEAYYQQSQSPRVSEEHGRTPFPDEPNFYEDPEDDTDDERVTRNGDLNGIHGADHDMEDGEDAHGDDDMDDDMMDKISSSPSIDDGNYPLPVWLPVEDSASRGVLRPLPALPPRGILESSSPPLDVPVSSRLPLVEEVEIQSVRHQSGESSILNDIPAGEVATQCRMQHHNPSLSRWQDRARDQDSESDSDYVNLDSDSQDFNKYLLPTNDPVLEEALSDYQLELADGADSVAHDDDDDDDDDDWEDEDSSTEGEEADARDDHALFIFIGNPQIVHSDSTSSEECLLGLEDIDFDFVYALHTFVATVEGQANATKGDTMVLLDDSNSYWWLVRVVKDGSIGYLPAEHIETPTERLARLNKHRNIDLSARMLGDNPEKSKNPLKIAMRRRNAKTVQFSAPTYYEPSDYEYSDDEDGEEGEGGDPHNENGAQIAEQDASEAKHAEPEVSAPSVVSTEPNGVAVNGIQKTAHEEDRQVDAPGSPAKATSTIGHVTIDQTEDALLRSRKGNVRNTDSFFKDDSVETRKISLTPRLLRGDTDSSAIAEQPEERSRPSLDVVDRILGPDEKPKEDKKKKEKKGMLSGLFKRKDKSGKASKNDDNEKSLDDSTRLSPQSKNSMESLGAKPERSPERKSSKKQLAPVLSNKSSPVDGYAQLETVSSTSSTLAGSQPLAAVKTQSLRSQVSHDSQLAKQGATPVEVKPADQETSVSTGEKKSFFAPITNALRSTSSNASLDREPSLKPVYSKRAKNRFELDDAASEDENRPISPRPQYLQRSVSPLAPVEQSSRTPADHQVGVSPIEASPDAQQVHTPQSSPLTVDTAPLRPAPNQSSRVANNATGTAKISPTRDPSTPSTSRSTPTWSDSSLRSYMDNDQDIKDLLIIIHDKSNVTPAGPDHPLVGGLFVAEKTRLAEMNSHLDSLLMNWISRKNSGLLSSR